MKRNSTEDVREFEFTNLQTPGGILKFSYGPTDNLETYTLIPGGRYKLREDVYNHVISRGSKNDDWRADGRGQLSPTQVGTTPYYSLRPIGW